MDGFRTLVFSDGDEVVLLSRSGKDLGRYFPEVIESVRDELAPRCVLDGEIVIPREIVGRTRLDWESLSQRIHPAASRVRMLSAQTPAHFIGFDALALNDTSLLKEPLRVRRQVLIDQMEGNALYNKRFRHTVKFVRWRPDRDPAGCTFEQLDVPLNYDLYDVLESGG